MKPLLTLALCAIMLLHGCAERCEPIQNELQEAKMQLDQRDSLLNAIGSAFRTVDSNLLTIRATEADLVQQLESGKTDKELIRAHVDKLKYIMSMNQARLDQLRDNLSAMDVSGNLMSIVHGMEEKIAGNNLRMVKLNDRLGVLGADFENALAEYIRAEQNRSMLEEDLRDRKGAIDKLDAQIRELNNNLNTAYIAMGTKRELIDAGVLEKGGLLKPRAVNEDLDQMVFKPCDIRELKEIDLGAEKVKILTKHPTESYSLQKERGTTVLHIESPQNFWKLSRFLIVIHG